MYPRKPSWPSFPWTSELIWINVAIGQVTKGLFSLLLFAVGMLSAGSAYGQDGDGTDLGQLYRRARTVALAEQRAGKPAPHLPPLPLRTPRLDSLQAWLSPEGSGAEARPVPLPPIRDRRALRRLEQPVFASRFADTRWAYLGTNGRGALDTMLTRSLRARLQAHYGDPTRTAVDVDSHSGGEPVGEGQFEYWFIANDSIPVKVMDTGGPFDRGLVFAAPARFRDRLRALRDAFFAPLLSTRLRAPYVDYYYDTGTEKWYRAGYDGRRYFVEPVRQEVVPGRRPVLPGRQ